MASEYSIDVCIELEERVHNAILHRPMRIERYDPGTELIYNIQAVAQRDTAKVHVLVEQFVGGGFAGQVYKVKLLGIEPPFLLPASAGTSLPLRRQGQESTGAIDGLQENRCYAMKILVPPSSFSRLFRNFLYWIGFQGSFQLQVNPAAVRAGALWQKFIRRGSKIRFGDENTVVDIYATFVDENLGSCGELSEWVDGRTWLLEVDDRMDVLKKWRRGKNVNKQQLNSPEYRAKYEFIHRFVELLHDMGAYEFARQYEWSTCKSQPNCLKRFGAENTPAGGLVAIDFRAGLALLPFLPMSPGDFKLITRGVARGSLVQFDRGNISKLEAFVQEHQDHFSDMDQALQELKSAEQVYRNSVPDITHNHIRLLYSHKLWLTMLDSAITSWKVRKLISHDYENKFRNSRILTLLFLLAGIIPIFGKIIRQIWARPDWRKHYRKLLTSMDYFHRSIQAKIAEKLISWHRAGRINGERALTAADNMWRFLCHLPFSILPAGLHRFLTDYKYAKQRIIYFVVRPVRLYFNAQLREQWLRDMVEEGKRKNMLSDEDTRTILSQVNEPFIQKYLKSLAVHVCTLPVTQIVSVTIAIIYVLTHPEMPRAQAWGTGLGIIALFQVVPISPGSLVRGLYVVYLVISERNFKDYNIAVFLGFFKYIGYLAFPIQMTYRYPALARFMAVHWATEAVHIVPVFGERGALLEHWVFCLFYNWPLTIRRRIRKRAEFRAKMQPRYWHVGFYSIAATSIFGLVDFVYINRFGRLPTLGNYWWLVISVAFVCGVLVTLGCRGATLGRRIIAAAFCGVLTGILHSIASAILSHLPTGGGLVAYNIMASCVWGIFIFTILSAIGAIFMELKLPESA